MANAARKLKAQQNVSKSKTKGPAQVEVEAMFTEQPALTPAETPPAEVTAKTRVRGKSIRQTIQKMVADGKNTAEITEVLVAEFPDSMAALKPNKHISFYRSRMRKENPGSVPVTATRATKEPTTVEVTTVSAKKGSVKAG